ncbi:MAG: hypothetical protein WAK01_08305 [Methylocystis sp.]
MLLQIARPASAGEPKLAPGPVADGKIKLLTELQAVKIELKLDGAASGRACRSTSAPQIMSKGQKRKKDQ